MTTTSKIHRTSINTRMHQPLPRSSDCRMNRLIRPMALLSLLSVRSTPDSKSVSSLKRGTVSGEIKAGENNNNVLGVLHNFLTHKSSLVRQVAQRTRY